MRVTVAGQKHSARAHMAYNRSDRVRLQFSLPTRSLTSSNGWCSIRTKCNAEKHEGERRAERELGHWPA